MDGFRAKGTKRLQRRLIARRLSARPLVQVNGYFDRFGDPQYGPAGPAMRLADWQGSCTKSTALSFSAGPSVQLQAPPDVKCSSSIDDRSRDRESRQARTAPRHCQ